MTPENAPALTSLASFSDLIGQTSAVIRMRDYSAFCSTRDTTPGHILLIGEDGTGKSCLAQTFANERGVAFQEAKAEEIVIQGDLTAILTNLREEQVLLLSQVNLLRRAHIERFVTAFRTGRVPINIGQGAAMRTHIMEVKPFTLIATCRRKSDCPAELIEEFSLTIEMQPYSMGELARIAERIAASRNQRLTSTAAELLVRYCERKPRSVETAYLRVARSTNNENISERDVREFFALSGMRMQAEVPITLLGDGFGLSGQAFEELIARLLERMEFRTEMTKVSGDGGIDIVAFLNKPIIGGRYLFQCKRYGADKPIGAPTVRDFYGAVTADRAVKGVFITTSDFTPQAREFAEKAGIELIGLAQLKNLLAEYGLKEGGDDIC